jgi:hypothetical protein
MKRLVITVYMAGLAVAIGVPPTPGPRVGTPHTPPAFETRNTGVDKQEEAKFPDKKKPAAPEKRKFTAVSEMRNWKDAKGTLIRARLLAFEPGDRSGSAEPLTLVRNGKIRLLAEGRKMFSELPLARLSKEDQAFVKALDTARKKSRSGTTTATKPASPGK